MLRAAGTSVAHRTTHAARIILLRRTTPRAAASEPAIAPEGAVAARGDRLVASLADEPPDLAHPIAVPQLRETVVANVADDFFACPVVRAHQHVAVVQDARGREWNGAVSEPGP